MRFRFSSGPVAPAIGALRFRQPQWVFVLTRPVADWSRARPWTTFQGDAGHTGRIAATLDPVVFTTLDRGPRTGYRPQSGFLRARRGFRVHRQLLRDQMAFALDFRDGARRWSVDFGSIHGVHPPAWDDGTVLRTPPGSCSPIRPAWNLRPTRCVPSAGPFGSLKGGSRDDAARGVYGRAYAIGAD